MKLTNPDPGLRYSPIIRIALGHDYSPMESGKELSVLFQRHIKLGKGFTSCLQLRRFDNNAGSGRGNSELTFKFLRDSNEDQRNHDKWRDSDYQQMLSFLRRVLGTKKILVVTYVRVFCLPETTFLPRPKIGHLKLIRYGSKQKMEAVLWTRGDALTRHP